ncbi:MAG: FAD-dependent oxidoreductase [Paracoccus sp. (in: a-proteobacteria)]|uniref:NAD(P)/FAD-dependent oxidoreductase n=1 Tax=Paracoccus sp. TaxID=267 RepID=UPI0039E40581
MSEKLNEQDRVVVIGSGHAGVELCAALRQRGYAGQIDILGEDPAQPYQRPPLSKDYMKRPDAPQALRSEQFYRDNNVGLRTGVRVSAIRREDRKVELDGGEQLSYDHLVIATGARNIRPPIPGLDTPHLLELRTLQDAARMAAMLPRLNRLAVIGAGFVGLEAAGFFADLGRMVEVVDLAPRVMQRAVSPETSAWFEGFHRANGVRLHLSDSVARIETEGEAVRLHLASGGQIEADAVLLAAGVAANDDLARAAGLNVADGVLVDSFLRTSDPAISAIGDCARFPPAGGGAATVRLESVQNAADQARCLAGRLTGDESPYAALPWFWSVQGSARLQIAGLALPPAAGQAPLTAVLRGDGAGGKLSAFVYDGDRLVAVETVNQAGDHMLARKLLGLGRPVAKEQAADSGFDLKTLATA